VLQSNLHRPAPLDIAPKARSLLVESIFVFDDRNEATFTTVDKLKSRKSHD